MKTLNIIALQQKQTDEARHVYSTYASVPNQLQNLVEVIKLYRRQEQAYFDKIKRKEFAGDKLHHMKKTQEKLDRMLSIIP